MSDLGRCAACGEPAHRYGRNEGAGRFDPMACINGLRGRLEGAPTAWRCLEHKADFLEQTPDEYSLCMSMLYEDAWNALPEPEPCRAGRVRLVVEGET